MRWKELGRALRDAREDRGWSQGQLATTAGVAKTTISRIENLSDADDDNNLPRIDSLDRIVGALQIGPLSRFLARFEGIAEPDLHPNSTSVTSSVPTFGDTASSAVSRGAHAESGLAAADPDALRLLQRLALALLHVIDPPKLPGED